MPHIYNRDKRGETIIKDVCDCCHQHRRLRLRILGRMVYRKDHYYQEEVRELNWLCYSCRKFFSAHFYGAITN